jgi:hypothetical protein
MNSQTVTCECGLTWLLRKIKQPMRDNDSLQCKCGRTLIEWNGGCTWVGELVRGEGQRQ